MKFILPAADLRAAIKKIALAVSSRPANPVLGLIHASLSGGTVTLTTTDLHVTIAYSISTATVEGEGIMLIPFNELKNLLALLTDDISIYEQDGSITLSSGLDIFCLGKATEPKEYPKLPKIADGRVFPIAEDILSFIGVAALGVSSDENRAALTHILLELDKGGANIVSCDVNSLYVKTVKADIDIEEHEKLLIPASVAKIIESMTISSIGFNKNHAVFSTPDLKVYFKRLDAIYPNYRSIMPVHETNVTVEVDKLDGALAKALVVNHDFNFNGIDLNISPESIQVASVAKETGMSAACFINAKASECKIPNLRVNGRILKRLISQGSAHREGSILEMSVIADNKAVSIKLAGDDTLTIIVMPIAKGK